MPRLPAAHIPGVRLRRTALLLALLPLSGCFLPGFLSYPPQARGNRIDAEQVKEMVPGTSTRADAMAALGSPTTKAPFDDNTWIYIGEITRPVIGGTQEVLDQQVVVLNFDGKGVLQGVQRKTADDGKSVTMVARATPSPGSDATILQQLLGNVGRFNASGPASATNNRSGSTSSTLGGT